MIAAMASTAALSLFPARIAADGAVPSPAKYAFFQRLVLPRAASRRSLPGGTVLPRRAVAGGAGVQGMEEEEEEVGEPAQPSRRRSADWETARAYKESGLIHEGRVEGCNAGGLLVRFYSIIGFLPYPQLAPTHYCKEPHKGIHDVAKGLTGSLISVKVIEAVEETKRLIVSEKLAIWSNYSPQVNIDDIFEGRVGFVEDYGAFVHLRFPDGYYYLTGLVHVSEVSWDLVSDVRDVLNEGDPVRVKVIQIDRVKHRITLSIKQLEEDPLLETLDKVIPQAESNAEYKPDELITENIPGLENICEELLKENGISDVRLGRRGNEKRVVSQDLELWLSNVPSENNQFTLLARAGRQVQEVHLTASLNQDDIRKAVQRVLGRVP